MINVGASFIGATIVCERAAESRLRITVQGQVTRFLRLAYVRLPDPLNSLHVRSFHFHRSRSRDQVHRHHHPAGVFLAD